MITDRRRKDNGTFGRLLRNTPPESTNSFTPNGSNAIGFGEVSASMDKQELAPTPAGPERPCREGRGPSAGDSLVH